MSAEPEFDVVVRGGRWFDGTGAASATRDAGVPTEVVGDRWTGRFLRAG